MLFRDSPLLRCSGIYSDICRLNFEYSMMLRKFFLFLSCLFLQAASLFAQQKDGPTKFYFPGGQLSSEGTMVNGKPDGYWKSYYENGKLKSEGNRVNFKLDSTWRFYNDSGVVTSELNYKEGIRHGVQKTFYENGNLQSEETDSM